MVCNLSNFDVACWSRMNMARPNETLFPYDEAFKVLLEQSLAGTQNLDDRTSLLLTVAYVLLLAVGVVANCVVCFVVVRRAQMQTPRNIYIVNLAVSDLTLCLICMPFTLAKLLRRSWVLGACMCKLVPFIQGTNIMVSIGTITVIALDRYFTIVRGCDASNSRRRVYWSILLVWVFSAWFALPVAYYQAVIPAKIGEDFVMYEVCLEQWPSQAGRMVYTVVVLLCQAVVPASVLILVHLSIAAHLHCHARTQSDGRRAARELARNKRTTFILAGVALLFLLSWLPLNAYMLAVDVMYPQDDVGYKLQVQDIYLPLAICHLIAMSSAVSNPIVYGLLNSNIRHELLQLLPKKCVPAPSRHQVRRNATEEHTTRTNLQTFNATGGISKQGHSRQGSEENLTTAEIVINNNKDIITMF
ncbi:unnamed protein product [Bemisia tabaci]|uniref:G-protein coupled receptors family 1 profile domain-containing protein n=1 Tax=Bemisia tabaci TaxID=7038 RepID=A0A9P0AAY7_BEMTA|nr:unnamed protein product [Bemisia tabaci]